MSTSAFFQRQIEERNRRQLAGNGQDEPAVFADDVELPEPEYRISSDEEMAKPGEDLWGAKTLSAQVPSRPSAPGNGKGLPMPRPADPEPRRRQPRPPPTVPRRRRRRTGAPPLDSVDLTEALQAAFPRTHYTPIPDPLIDSGLLGELERAKRGAGMALIICIRNASKSERKIRIRPKTWLKALGFSKMEYVWPCLALLHELGVVTWPPQAKSGYFTQENIKAIVADATAGQDAAKTHGKTVSDTRQQAIHSRWAKYRTRGA
jgi:hypothetical protein